MLLRELFLTAEFFQIIQRITLPGKDPVHCNLPHHIVDLATGKIVVLGKEHCVIFIETVQLVHPDMFLGLNAGSLELYLEKEAPLKCRIQAAFKIGCGDENTLLLSSRRVLRFTFSFNISLPVLFDNAKVTKLTAIFRQ